MGVPAFFRWLSQNFPKIIVDVIEQESEKANAPIDTSEPNPNGIEFDNLYLDMNGIIHPCSHPEDRPAPKTEEEILNNIMDYVDRLFAIVRPRKLLYLAIDGVAPRAKMNQQRSRRFKSAKEAEHKRLIEAEIQEKMRENSKVPLKEENKEPKLEFDSNCITPGTEFMDKVSKSLQFYIVKRLNSDPGWKGIQVIFSDGNSPGEGEHKIMEFIRIQRSQPDYDPNTKHVICGLDADLIMLGLATHEAHFSILRETVFFGNSNACHQCGQPGHLAANCPAKERPKQGEFDEMSFKKKPYQFLHIFVLREYLRGKLLVKDLPFEYDFERAIDDWVFLCFFVGNDFLPHMPTLEIREGAIDLLTGLYKKILPMTGYLTHHGIVHFDRVEHLLAEISDLEDTILARRLEQERIRAERDRKRKEREKREKKGYLHVPAFTPQEKMQQDSKNKEAAALLRAALLDPSSSSAAESPSSQKKLKQETTTTTTGSSPMESREKERKSSLGKQEKESSDKLNESRDEETIEDEIRLGEEGWKERYYKKKFGVEMSDKEFFAKIRHSYLEGLAWVLKYYYWGCPSWKWYFPFHFAPFASELIGGSHLSSKKPTSTTDSNSNNNNMKAELMVDDEMPFELGKPFSPLEQLMGVLPPGSAALVPKRFQPLMMDDESPLRSMYPKDFLLDYNGKKQSWLAVAILPFLDEEQLLLHVQPLEEDLPLDLIHRNSKHLDLLYVHQQHPYFGTFFSELYQAQVKVLTNPDPEAVEWNPIPSSLLQKSFMTLVAGHVACCPDSYSPLASLYPVPETLATTHVDVLPNHVVPVFFRNPLITDPLKEIIWGLLPAAVMPDSVLTPFDNHPDFMQQGGGGGGGYYGGGPTAAPHPLLREKKFNTSALDRATRHYIDKPLQHQQHPPRLYKSAHDSAPIPGTEITETEKAITHVTLEIIIETIIIVVVVVVVETILVTKTEVNNTTVEETVEEIVEETVETLPILDHVTLAETTVASIPASAPLNLEGALLPTIMHPPLLLLLLPPLRRLLIYFLYSNLRPFFSPLI